MLVLSINSGSSSLKCAVIDPHSEQTMFAALVDELGTPRAKLRITASNQAPPKTIEHADHTRALAVVIEEIRNYPEIWGNLAAVGHRVVHGGESFTASVLINADVISAISDCVPLAPLHNSANLLGIKAAQAALPDLPHVAVFDTAFHQTMPETAYRYAVPSEWYQNHHIRRYGFHGTSHRFVIQRASEILERPLNELHLLSAHLGNGCSVAAIQSGKCVDTSMGFTPLEGLVMGTRSGDLDPAIIFHLEKSGLTLPEIERALNQRSGLLGLSDLSNDMRILSERYEDHAGARLAINVFCHRLAKYLGAFATSFDRLDGVIFTGGIGEHSSLVRNKVVERLAVFGIFLDDTNNASHAPVISTQESSSAVLVVPTNEELLIARDVLALTTN